MTFGLMSFAQSYSSYGNDGYPYSNYENYNDYPDDYYYDFPMDYYPQSYYESYYNDYRNSITSINWKKFFHRYHLSDFQIQQILYLNSRYPDFVSWNYYYGPNPDRWYFERFHALQIILGPRIFISFQNRYYHGYSPVVYYQNYRRSYYIPRYQVRAPYRNVNIIYYKIDKSSYNPRANNGLYDPNQNGTSTRWRNDINKNNSSTRPSNGFRTPSSVENNSSNQNSGNGGNSGFRTMRRSQAMKPMESPRQNNNGGGFRRENVVKNERSSQVPRTAPREASSSAGRGGGFR